MLFPVNLQEIILNPPWLGEKQKNKVNLLSLVFLFHNRIVLQMLYPILGKLIAPYLLLVMGANDSVNLATLNISAINTVTEKSSRKNVFMNCAMNKYQWHMKICEYILYDVKNKLPKYL